MKVLQWLLQHGVGDFVKANEYLGDWLLAVSSGKFEVVKFALSIGLKTDSKFITNAVQSGSEAMAELMRQHGAKPDSETLAIAAGLGDLDLVKQLHSEGITPNIRAAEMAADRGHINVLRWLADHGVADPDSQFVERVESMKYLVEERGHIITNDDLALMVLNRRYKVLQYAKDHLQGLELAHARLWTVATQPAFLDPPMLKLLHVMGLRLDAQYANDALEDCRLDILKWLHAHGAPMDSAALAEAATKHSIVATKEFAREWQELLAWVKGLHDSASLVDE